MMRRRNVERDDDQASSDKGGQGGFVSPAVKKKFRRLDLYPKLVEEERLKTSSGGIVSLITLSIVAILFISELSRYLSNETEEHIMVDPTVGEKLEIDFDITFHALRCGEVNLDAMDVAGDQQNGINHDISKLRLDKKGRAIGSAFAHSLDDEDIPKPVSDDPNYCGSCYGAETEELKCCNTCEQVKQSYAAKGWNSAEVLNQAEQCRQERESKGLVSKPGEGCRIYGSMEVNKVAGNFHVAMGDTVLRDGRHIHEFNPQQLKDFNTSHTIHKLSFGPLVHSMSNPLDGTTRSPQDATGVYQYSLKLVPTWVEKTFKTVKTNQYSYTYQFRPAFVDGQRQNVLPGVFIIYDFSPFLVKIKNAHTPLLEFLTSVCAIIGGAFAISGLIEQLVSSLMNLTPQPKSLKLKNNDNAVAEKCCHDDRDKAFPASEVAQLVETYGLRPLGEFLTASHRNSEFKLKQPPLSRKVFGALYTAVTKCSLEPERARYLHKALVDFSRDFLSNSLRPKLSDASGPQLLLRFIDVWTSFILYSEWTAKLFRYVNNESRYMDKAISSALFNSTNFEILFLFNEELFQDFRGLLCEQILHLIKRIRTDETTDKHIVSDAVSAFLAIDLLNSDSSITSMPKAIEEMKSSFSVETPTYSSTLEKAFLNASKTYYFNLGQSLYDDKDGREYLKAIDNIFSKEADLANGCLHKKTVFEMKNVLIDSLLRPHYQSLLDGDEVGVCALIARSAWTELTRIVNLFSQFQEGRNFLYEKFEESMRQESTTLKDRYCCKKDSPMDKKLTVLDSFMEQYRRYKYIVKTSFNGAAECLQILRQEVVSFSINWIDGDRQFARLLARYAHRILRQYQEEDNWKLDNALDLLCIVNHQDCFLDQYEILFADRLLHNGTFNRDMEKSMISRLTLDMGNLATRRMEGMYRDVTETNVCVMEIFQKSCGQAQGYFEPCVLSTSHWPFDGPSLQISPPCEFQQIADLFGRFYEKHYNFARKLTWLWSKGRVHVYAHLKNQQVRTLRGSVLQAFVLLLFNRRQRWTVEQMAKELNCPVESTKRVVHSLTIDPGKKSRANEGILKRDCGTDNFICNLSYQSRLKVIKLPIPVFRDRNDSKEEDKVDKDRRFELDAVIVRVMKMRQRVAHEDLMFEVQNHIRRFNVERKVVKQRIEDLIGREYIARDPDCPTRSYVYVS